MNMNYLFGSILISITLVSSNLLAQFSMTGEIRPRTEYLHGFNSLADTAQDPAFWTEQRSRLYMDYKADRYQIGIVVQDIRTWGSTPQLNKSDDFYSVHEAWGAFSFNDKLSVKFGRQEIIYDDHRIFGSVAWAQQARSHDLAKFRYQDTTGNTIVDLGLAYNQDATKLTDNIYTVANNYKTFQYVWMHRKFNKHFKGSLLFLNNGLQYSEVNDSGDTEYSVKYSQTAGTHLVWKKNKIKSFVSGYYQTGKDRTDRDLNAFDARAELIYSISEKLSLGAGYELLSGTSETDTANKENNSFTPFFGTNHKFNGYMDYFYVGNHINSVGLQDIYFTLGYKVKKFAAKADVHLFSTAADLLDDKNFIETGEYKAMDANLGTELDLTLKYKFSDVVAFQAGYSHMLATESMEVLKGGDKDEINNWAYFMITIKPVFIAQE